MIAAFLASVGSGFAGSHLPKCQGSPAFSDYGLRRSWHNCIGKFTYKYLKNISYYVGEYRGGLPSGQGVEVIKGKIKVGIWKTGEFQYFQKTPYSVKTTKPSLLRTVFIKLSKEQRKQLQSNLKDLGF